MTKLQNLYELFSDSIIVSVINKNSDKEIARYDGRNSIPEMYNDMEVDHIYIDWENREIRLTVDILKNIFNLGTCPFVEI